MPKTTAPDTSASTTAKHQRRTHLERTELSDRRMFEATESLILEVGTQKTTLKEVGERAGYSRGLANARFGNKETLFLKLADRCRRLWLDELNQAAGDKRGLAAFLSRFDAIASYSSNSPEDARVMYILWFESVGSNSDMKESLARFHQQARDDIRNLIIDAKAAGEIAQDISPECFAAHFTSTLFGLCYQWVVNPYAIDVAQLMADIKQQMLLVLRPTSSVHPE
ncbi:TetR/AcrR family transcriptional regulator [Pseudomaricurvus alkylphenolicus]|jgi:AcrR family transcriptional regulator|uniref:TetR/AcrR family transcriptional regulator n=1 Tax=Pseudomaricurvus alkylphenolicus TaxID=1306991 RepID=UPI001423B62D|nr:TetR/AcrR family transcriptional regulator [Pseudomaricurvus alkylphenolicus]NIB41064.1 TetR/AcrR family transcriptional regulator [Pseudomaricurvus alkylphenolicus]